jgi:hypothetical protein
VQRTLASVLLTIGLAVASLTLSAWWFRQSVLDPSRTAKVAEAVIDDPQVREALSGAISQAIVAKVPNAPPDLAATVAARLGGLQDPSFLGKAIQDAHARLVGAATGPVTLENGVLLPLVDASVAEAAGQVSWEVPTVSPLAKVRKELDKLITLGVIVGLGLVVAGFLLHPRHDQALRTVGGWALGAAAWSLLTAWVLPVYVLPRLVDNPWTSVAGAVAQARMSSLLGVLLALAGAGVACLVVSVVFAPGRLGGNRAATPEPAPTPAQPQPGAWPNSYRQPLRSGTAPKGFSGSHRRTSDGHTPDDDGWML